MAKVERADWTVLGRIIGSASGWDQSDTFVMMLYDFVPAASVALPEGTICIDFENGVAEFYDDAGVVISSHDLLIAFAGLPLIPKVAA